MKAQATIEKRGTDAWRFRVERPEKYQLTALVTIPVRDMVFARCKERGIACAEYVRGLVMADLEGSPK